MYFSLVCKSHYRLDWVSAIHSSKWKNLKNFFQTYIKWNIKIQLTVSRSHWVYDHIGCKLGKKLQQVCHDKKNQYSHLFKFWYQNSLIHQDIIEPLYLIIHHCLFCLTFLFFYLITSFGGARKFWYHELKNITKCFEPNIYVIM